jgi:hypothetical protein
VAAVEKVPAPKEKRGHAIKRQDGFFAGNARIAVLRAAKGEELGAFLKANVAAGSHLLTEAFAGYCSEQADLGAHLRHTPIVQDQATKAAEYFPIIHTLFSNTNAWLAGTHHGVWLEHRSLHGAGAGASRDADGAKGCIASVLRRCMASADRRMRRLKSSKPQVLTA